MKQIFQKNKVVTDKTTLFVIDPFCSRFCGHSSDRAVLHGNDVLSVLMVSTKKRYPSFLKKVFVSQKTELKLIFNYIKNVLTLILVLGGVLK